MLLWFIGPMVHSHLLIDWSKATILSTEKDYTKRLFAVSWLINKSSNVINRNDGNALPSVYKKLL